MTVTLEVREGPSLFGLATALFDRKADRGSPKKIRFRLSNEKSLFTAIIKSAEAIDDSGESWKIRGFTTHVQRADDSKLPNYHALDFRGTYNTGDRWGSFEFYIT